MANDYLQHNPNIESAAKKFINNQVLKCTTSGFLTNVGGLITLPVAIPANISSVLYVQMRMISCLAYMGGYDVGCDQVQTLIYACLAGISVDQLLKNIGIQFGTKFTMALVKKIPRAALVKINQRVGFRFITKAGSTGIINISKAVPVIGGIVGGSFDLIETKVIAQRAYNLFIKGNCEALSFADDGIEYTVADVE